MKNLFMLFGIMAGLFAFQPADARGADFSGIWIVKYDKYQIVVTGSADKYSFKKISFYRGKRTEHTGTFTVQNNFLRITYSVGQKAMAKIISPTHVIESSTVNWHKVSDSTACPVFNLSGSWKHFNSEITLEQKGNTVTGTKYLNNKEYSKFSGEVEGYLLRLTETMAGSARPMEHSLVILDNNRLVFSSGRAGQDNLWTRAGGAVERPRAVRENTPDRAASYKIAGNWVIEGVKSSVAVSENRLGVFFNTTLVLNKQQVRWVGSGSLKGDDLVMKYRYVKNRPPGFEDGTMRLKVVNNDRIEGKWVAASGKFSDKIVFLRKKP